VLEPTDVVVTQCILLELCYENRMFCVSELMSARKAAWKYKNLFV